MVLGSTTVLGSINLLVLTEVLVLTAVLGLIEVLALTAAEISMADLEEPSLFSQDHLVVAAVFRCKPRP